MTKIKMFLGEDIPIEMHKVKIIQKINLVPVDERLTAIQAAGNNTFLLRNNQVFLDMITDSGVNAMSDRQQAAMLIADDSYAGSESFYRLEAALHNIFQKKYFLPAHQGRACEHIISKIFVKKGDVIPMNYHFTTVKGHITDFLGTVEEVYCDEAVKVKSDCPFKGNADIGKLKACIKKNKGKIPFARLEMGTNLIGGQPVSLQNVKDFYAVCKENNIPLVIDASLLTDNLFFIKTREEAYKDWSLLDITREIAANCDIIYFSGRKLGSARGGGICTSDKALYERMRVFIPVYEGFLTYGGMSVKEMEAMAIGLGEAMDMDMISHAPEFISYMVDELTKYGIPVVTPSGGLGCHLDASEFCKHIPQEEFRAGALASAFYLCSGVRGMERGTMSEQRNEDGSEHFAEVELLRLALPRRVFTMSQVKYTVDRLLWLFKNRNLIGGLEWDEEPDKLRFFFGKLRQKGHWQEKLVAKFKEDFGDSL